jgi:hypothetical protein
MEENEIYTCECNNKECVENISTEEYRELRKSELYNSKNSFITLKSHLPQYCKIFKETETLYLW